VAPTEVNIDLN
jgi:hypothetical protein